MNNKVIKNWSSAVAGSHNVTIDIIKEEANELRQALAVIQKYEKEALRSYKNKLKYNPKKSSDWCEISYCVKNDKVIVTIEDGMAG